MSDTTTANFDFRATTTASSPAVMRTAPQAVSVEKSLLSMMAIEPLTIIARCISDGMNGDYFYVPAHRILWELLRECFDKGVTIDTTTIAQRLEDRKQLETVGGVQGLVDVFTYATTCGLYEAHFAILKEKYIRRSIILASNRSIEAAYTSEAEIDHILDETEQEVMKIRTSAARDDSWDFSSTLKEAVTNLERIMNGGDTVLGITTGFPLLDRKVNGLKPGELFVIAARPSMGKTSFMMNIIEHMVLDLKKTTLCFSCEMPAVQLLERLLMARSGVSRNSLRCGKSIPKGEMKKLSEAVKELKSVASSTLIIDDTAAISISELRAKARRVQREHPDLCCIGIDYLQLMRSHTTQAQNSREREIAELSGGLKSLAKELHIPIVVLAQLNRGPENRPGKNKGVPMMSDLRESGAIEQDADMIGLLYRTAYYAEDDEERANAGADANLILAKNRNGETGDIPLTFKAEIMRFVPREAQEEENPNS